MPDLERAITEWRQTLRAARDIEPDTLDELENHLRETIEQLLHSGVSEAEAFPRAVTQLGPPAAVAGEFRKLSAFRWWPVRIVTVVWMAEFLYLVCSPWNIEVFGLKFALGFEFVIWVVVLCLGFSAVILHGVLGACFVMQWCYSDFSPRRLQSLSRISQSIAWVGAVLIIVDLFWSVIGGGELNVQAWLVVAWLVGFLAAHYSRWVSTRGLFLASLLGSNLLLIFWFRPSLGHGLFWQSGGYSSGDPMQMFWAFVGVPLWILNVLLFLVGLAPAGWLRLRKASHHE